MAVGKSVFEGLAVGLSVGGELVGVDVVGCKLGLGVGRLVGYGGHQYPLACKAQGTREAGRLMFEVGLAYADSRTEAKSFRMVVAVAEAVRSPCARDKTDRARHATNTKTPSDFIVPVDDHSIPAIEKKVPSAKSKKHSHALPRVSPN
jgi:hypothetical protein